MMKKIRSLTSFSCAIALSSMLLTGCAGFLLGDENLSEPVDLPSVTTGASVNHAWSTNIGDGTDDMAMQLHPFVTRAAIYAVSNDGTLEAVDTNTGATLWSQELEHKVTAGVSGDERILVVGTGDGMLMAFLRADGTPLWNYRLSSEIVAAPMVVNGMVVARTTDGQITAMTAERGATVWKQSIGVTPFAIRGNARSLYFDGVFLFTSGSGHVTMLDAKSGRFILDAPISRGTGLTRIQRLSDLLATPVIRGSTLFVSAYRHETLAFDLRSGDVMWKRDVATALDLFADNRLIYIVDKNSIIHALDLASGTTVWTSNVLEGRKISPLAGDGRTLVTVDYEGNLIALDVRDGSVIAQGKVGSGRSYVAPQWFNDKWLTYTSDGDLTLSTINK